MAVAGVGEELGEFNKQYSDKEMDHKRNGNDSV